VGRPIPEIAGKALNESFMRAVLHSIAKERFGALAAITKMDVDHYKRGVYRYDVALNVAGKPLPDPWRIIGKVYDTIENGQSSFNKMRKLWDNGFVEKEPFYVRIPEAYQFLPDLRLLLMEEAPGNPLKKMVKKQTAKPLQMQRFASTLAKIHRFPLVLSEPFTIERHLKTRCHSLAEPMAAAIPKIRDEIHSILDFAKDFQQRSGHEHFTMAHGDFHLSQVHLQKHIFWVLDLDPIHYGDPAYDVAMVLFSLKLTASKKSLAKYTNSLRDSFLESYFSTMGWDIARRVPLHEAMIHLKRACKRYRFQDEEGWEALIPKQIKQATTCIEVMKSVSTPNSVSEMIEISERCPVIY